MYSSVYFNRFNSKIHAWEYNEEGKKIHNEYQAPLYFYLKDESGEYTSIYGDKLKRMTFDSYQKMKEARDMFKSAGRTMFESDIDPESRFIFDTYSGKELKIPVMDIHYIDIEVHSEKGFPKPDVAEHPITIITVFSTKHNKWFIWSEKEFSTDFDIKIKKGKTPSDDVIVKFSTLNPWIKICKDEKEMLQSFIAFIKKFHPDIISGWNSSGFDIPYIINRSNKLLGEDATKQLSPVKYVRKIVKKSRFGKSQEIYEIAGINSIDYLHVYKKYVPGEQESFKLGHIAEIELGESKLEFKGTLKELYRNDWQRYCEYNIQDVNLLCLLDGRLKYMSMMINICYNCKIPFEEFDKTTKVLDGAFISRLMLDKVILPDVVHTDAFEEKYEGAYVKEPIPGIYDWVMCFDATSLYPSIMMQHNMSPETKVMVVSQTDADFISEYLTNNIHDDDTRLDEYTSANKTFRDVIQIIKDNGYTIASNGAIYRHDKEGVVSKFVKEWFDNRVHHKNMMKKAGKEGNTVAEQYHDSSQYIMKIFINSVYGYVGSKYSRLYDRDNALAVTVTGQYAIKSVEKAMVKFFTQDWENTDNGKKLKVKNLQHTPAIYFDTDSAYLHVGQVLRAFNYPHINDKEVCLKFIQEKMEPFFQKIITNEMQIFTKKKMNAKECKISFKREMISRRTIFMAKKRYIAYILDMEGKIIPDGDDHEIEAKGIELVRTSIPKTVREWMKELLTIVLKNVDKKASDEKIKEVRHVFHNIDITSIAKIISINNIEQYTDSSGNPTLGTPQQVKSAIGHNLLIEKNNLEDFVEKIHEGDKVKLVYLKENPLYKFNAIAFKDNLPKEFKLDQYVDYDIMWEKLFVDPMTKIYDTIGWKMPNFDQEDITDLFT